MEQNLERNFSQKLSCGVSVFLHAILLLGAYYVPLRPSNINATSYSITLTLAQSYQHSSTKHTATETLTDDNPLLTPVSTHSQGAAQPSQAKLAPQQITEEIAPESANSLASMPDRPNTAQQGAEATEGTSEAAKKEVTDERGLYKNVTDKQTSTLLELIGWIWDTTPAPHDDTSETGKIVFEIKIDDLGEVIAVKTLEKTVSPLVEKIYKDALTELTFSKTTSNTTYNPVSVGKVTFILRTK